MALLAADSAVFVAALLAANASAGAKDLGCPTANMRKEDLGNSLDDIERGIYAGWAMVDGAGPFKAVASVGFNPTFTDVEEKIVEPHLIHDFGDNDFYGAELRFVICAYLRPEWKFVDGDGGFNFPLLIEAIQNDVKVADAALELEQFSVFRRDPALLAGGASNL